MKPVYFCIVVFLSASASTHAGRLEISSGRQQAFAEPSDQNGVRKIKFCRTVNDKVLCENFPTDLQTASAVFKGNQSDWQGFLDRCKGLDGVNQMTSNVHLLTSLAGGGGAFVAARVGSKFGSAAVASRTLPGIGGASGSVSAYEASELSDKVIHFGPSLGSLQMPNTSPYPNTTDFHSRDQTSDGEMTVFARAHNQINHLLNGTGIVRNSLREMAILNAVLSTCSVGFNQHLISQQHRDCMNGCHSRQTKNAKPAPESSNLQELRDYVRQGKR